MTTAPHITADTKAHFVITHVENGELVTMEVYGGDETLKEALCGVYNADADNFEAHMKFLNERGGIVSLDITSQAALIGFQAFYADLPDDDGILYAPGWVTRNSDEAADVVHASQDRAHAGTRWVDDAYDMARAV